MRRTLLLLAVAAAAAAPPAATPTAFLPIAPLLEHHCPAARQAIRFYSTAARGWQDRHDDAHQPPPRVGPRTGCGYVRWAAAEWRDRAAQARRDYGSWYQQVEEKWACIHSHEGDWTDEGWPQEGGLQFDADFQATYGKEFLHLGDAGHWPIWAQYLAAERAYHGYGGYGPRYWGPWPNTRLACGL